MPTAVAIPGDHLQVIQTTHTRARTHARMRTTTCYLGTHVGLIAMFEMTIFASNIQFRDFALFFTLRGQRIEPENKLNHFAADLSMELLL